MLGGTGWQVEQHACCDGRRRLARLHHRVLLVAVVLCGRGPFRDEATWLLDPGSATLTWWQLASRVFSRHTAMCRTCVLLFALLHPALDCLPACCCAQGKEMTQNMFVMR